jgi:hypothetical protein
MHISFYEALEYDKYSKNQIPNKHSLKITYKEIEKEQIYYGM